MRVLLFLLVVLVSAGVSKADEPYAGDVEGSLERKPAPRKALVGVGELGYWRDVFAEGAVEINRNFLVADGAGPFHNNLSSSAGAGCTSCHAPVNGFGGYTRQVKIYGFRGTGSSGESVFFPPQGLILRENAVPGTPLEVLPAWATTPVERKTPQLMGMGLVEAVPDQVFFDLAAANGGRVAVSPETGRVQRWGSQNQFATVLEVVNAAFVNEIGVTPEESEGDPSITNPIGLDPEILVWQYLLLLDSPELAPNPSANVLAGEQIFFEIGCDTCHTDTMTTGSGPLEVNGVTLDIDALKNVTFHPYSDYLLHDLGFPESDVHLGQAGRSEYRTAPLWGKRYDQTRDFHDQSQTSYLLEPTIQLHGGDAAAVREAYNLLTNNEKIYLRKFVNSR